MFKPLDKIILTSLAAAMSGVVCVPALAQSGSASSNVIEEMTVTAQRREVGLQEVPVAVTALNTADLGLKQIGDVQDLQYAVPNISIAANTGTANGARIFLRGVGEDESRATAEPAVGIYVDGIYIGRAVGALVDLVDLERVEVLRGPQGTLYGRNSNGGAIKLISKKPAFDQTVFDAGITTGSDGRLDGKLTGNFALSDNTAIRGSFMSKTRDGLHTLNPDGDLASLAGQEVGEIDTQAFRLALTQQFSDNWAGTFIFDITQDDSDPVPDSINVANDADDNLFTIEPLVGSPCVTGSTDVGCFTDYRSEVESSGYSFNLTGTLGNYTVQSLTGYRSLEDDLSTRIGSAYSQQTEQDQLSQEFTLTSNLIGPFNYVAGLYYFKEDILLNSVFFFPFSVEVKTDALAGFVQSTYDVTDAMTLTTGVRVTDETKDLNASQFFGLSNVDSQDFKNTTYTLNLDNQFTDNVLGYVSYSTGFKSGGWSPDCFSATACFLPVDEETLDSIEFGVRNTLLDDRLRLNATYFFNVYEGLQIAATVPGLGFTRFNVDEAEISGLEIETLFNVTESLTLNATLGTLDAEYTKLTLNQAGALTNQGASAVCDGVSNDIGGGVILGYDIACGLALELKNSPEYKGTLGVTYSMGLANGTLTGGVDVSFEDTSYNLAANPENALVDVSSLLNARVAYAPDSSSWSVALWGKNLTDEEYARSAAGSVFQYAADPLTWGLDFGYSF